ncbi:alginate export family protein [Massilia horti]|nr:alginate export family protein [Massilia horti]
MNANKRTMLCARAAVALVLEFSARQAGADTPDTMPKKPAPASFPAVAAGWGPELGNGLMASRWAEDWSEARQKGTAPQFKAMPVGDAMALTLSGEARLRLDSYHRAQLQNGKDYEQGLFRGILGADLRVTPGFRLFGELGTAQVRGQASTMPANFRNTVSMQQAFIEASHKFDGGLFGIMLGRQEFSDGPRQLISLSDGANLHRTWNGARFFVHAGRIRIGAFDLRVTRLGPGRFDEQVNPGERLKGVNAGFALESTPAASTYIEPFWYATQNQNFRLGGSTGTDRRDTVGVRLWGQQGRFRYDWTAARQTGSSLQRTVDAWGLFAIQSVVLLKDGWRPRLTTRIDAASGGGTSGPGNVRAFNPLYGSSSYLGEGQFLSLSNLLLVTPGITVSPDAQSNISVEYGIARRLVESDPAYGGGMRAYAGTQNISGKSLGGLLRVNGTWSISRQLTLFLSYEDMHAGPVLAHAGLHSGHYLCGGATYRY